MAKAQLGDVSLQRIRQSAGTTTPVGEPRTSRASKRQIAGFFEKPVWLQFHKIGLERDMTLQAQLTEALNDYFAKHGKPEIAE